MSCTVIKASRHLLFSGIKLQFSPSSDQQSVVLSSPDISPIKFEDSFCEKDGSSIGDYEIFIFHCSTIITSTQVQENTFNRVFQKKLIHSNLDFFSGHKEETEKGTTV
jgi:hypothetical protein